MVEGRYLYCITEATADPASAPGLSGRAPRVIAHKDIAAVVSDIPYAEPAPSLENIVAHENVVNAVRKESAVLPVKFGVIFRNEEGVKLLLGRSYESYRSKLDKFRGMDEYGVKVVLKTEGMKKLREGLTQTSKEIARMQRQASKAKAGRSYFLKLKMDEAVKAESFREIDKLGRQIHSELRRGARDSSLLKGEHEQIILNAAYLVKREDGPAFLEHAKKLGKGYASIGLMVHTSGPWAPYSFVESESK